MTNEVSNQIYIQQPNQMMYGYATGTTSGSIQLNNPHTYNTKEEYYNAISYAVINALGDIPMDQKMELNASIQQHVANMLREVMVLVDGPFGPVYRVKPEGFAHILTGIQTIVTHLLAEKVIPALKRQAEELKKTAGLGESPTHVGQPIPTAPLLNKAVWITHDEQARYGDLKIQTTPELYWGSDPGAQSYTVGTVLQSSDQYQSYNDDANS
jgi:hypothetical protein